MSYATMADEKDLDEFWSAVAAVERIIDRYKAEYTSRKWDWMLVNGELRRRRRGSPRWLVCLADMVVNDKGLWYDHYTGRRRNMADCHSDPVWCYETYQDRIAAEARDVFFKCGFFGFDDEGRPKVWSWFEEVLETLLLDAASGALRIEKRR